MYLLVEIMFIFFSSATKDNDEKETEAEVNHLTFNRSDLCSLLIKAAI